MDEQVTLTTRTVVVGCVPLGAACRRTSAASGWRLTASGCGMLAGITSGTLSVATWVICWCYCRRLHAAVSRDHCSALGRPLVVTGLHRRSDGRGLPHRVPVPDPGGQGRGQRGGGGGVDKLPRLTPHGCHRHRERRCGRLLLQGPHPSGELTLPPPPHWDGSSIEQQSLTPFNGVLCCLMLLGLPNACAER